MRLQQTIAIVNNMKWLYVMTTTSIILRNHYKSQIRFRMRIETMKVSE